MKYDKNIKCPECGAEIDPQIVNKNEDKSAKNAQFRPSNTETEIHPESFFKILWLRKFELWTLIVLFILLIVSVLDRLLTGSLHLWIDMLYIGGCIFFTVASLKDKKIITLADLIAVMLKVLFWPILFLLYYTIEYSIRLENKESLYRIILYVNKPQKNHKEAS